MILLFCTAIIGVFNFSKFTPPIKFISIYVIICFITELVGFYTLINSNGKQVNINIYKLYSFVEYVLIGTYFFLIIDSKKVKNGIIIWFITAIFLQILIIIFNLLPFHKAYLISISLKIIYAIIFHKQLLDTEESILSNPNFWIVTGILFFNAGFFFLSGFIMYISSKNLELASKLFSINHLLNIIYYSLVAYGFICQRRLAKSSS